MESSRVRSTAGRARRGLFPVLLGGLIALAFVAAACGDEDVSSDAKTTTTTTGTTTTGKAPGDFAPGTGLVSTSDGLDASLTVRQCTNHGETDIQFEAVSPDGGKLVVVADGNQKSVTWRAPGDEREGTVEQVQVGDLGNFTLSGKLSLADDSAAPATFTLVGTCPRAAGTTSTTAKSETTTTMS